MTLTKRELVMRIGEETGLNQSQVFEVVQKPLTTSPRRSPRAARWNCATSACSTLRSARRASVATETAGDRRADSRRAQVKFKAGKEMAAEVLKLTPSPKAKGTPK